MEVGMARVEGVGIVFGGLVGVVAVELDGEGVKGRSVVQASQQR